MKRTVCEFSKFPRCYSKDHNTRPKVSKLIREDLRINYFAGVLTQRRQCWSRLGSNLKIGDDNTYTSANEIRNLLNDHFCSVGLILVTEISRTNSGLLSMFVQYHSFSLTETSKDVVLKLIHSLPLNKANGPDKISVKLLKVTGPIVSPSLT